MIFLLILAFIIIILLEVPGLVKRQMWRELVAFSIYLLIGMSLSIPQALGIKMANPNEMLGTLFKPLGDILK